MGELAKPTIGSVAWGDDVNDNFSIIEKHSGASVRQTVLTGGVTNGQASFLGVGSGLAPALSASGSAPVIFSFADGFDEFGANETIVKLTSNQTFSGLTDNNLNFLYADLDGSDNVSYLGSLIPPQYGVRFPQNTQGLLHFNGTNGSTTMTDDYGNSWTAFGNAQLSTAQKKFGSASLLLDGTGDYIECSGITSFGTDNFTIEAWVRWASLPGSGTSQAIFSALNASAYGLLLYLNNTGGTRKLSLWASSNGTSWNIASASLGSSTTWSAGTWYHIAISYDGSQIRVFRDGAVEITAAMSAPISTFNQLRLGRYTVSSEDLNGNMDEFRYSPCARYTGSYTVPSAEFSEDACWFDLSLFKMKTGGPTGGWTNCRRLFVGEAAAASGSISSVVTYALRGQYDGGWSTVSANTEYNFSHNLGLLDVFPLAWLRTSSPIPLIEQVSCLNMDANSASYGSLIRRTEGRKTIRITCGKISPANYYSSSNNYPDGAATTSPYNVRVLVCRGW